MTAALETRGISKSFFGVPVLRDVSFTLGPGRVLGLIGENGAGKSTLMNILGGVLPPDAGSMSLEGAAYVPHTPLDARRRGVAFIHQELNLFPNLSIAENIFLTALPRKSAFWPLVARGEIAGKARALLAAVDLQLSPETLVERLSPGERQLVEIAKTLAFDARVVIFDEPTTSLTAKETERLFALIDRLRDEGRAIIFISHALGDVLRVSDEIVVLRDGQVVGHGAKTSFTIERMVSLMVGRTLDQMFPARATRPSDEVLLAAVGLSQPGVIEKVSFALHKGEVLGVAGLMGSGRTELARILFGMDPSREGDVLVGGERYGNRSPQASIARGLAFLTESRREEGLLMNAPLGDNVGLAALRGFAGRGLGVLDGGRLAAEVARVAGAVSIAAAKLNGPAAGASVKTLSGGNQQKVVLAKWLLTRPRVFILDEPTRGIDVGAKFEIYGLINELVAGGAGVLLISSELEELCGMADRILVMRRGEIAGVVAKEDFDRERIMGLAFGADAPATRGAA